MVAAAWSEVEADRGEPVGDSPRGTDALSPLVAMSIYNAMLTGMI